MNKKCYVQKILDQLLVVLKQKEKLMQQILLLSKRLVNETGDWDVLDNLLNARQEYIQKTDALDQQARLLRKKITSDQSVVNWEDLSRICPQSWQQLENIREQNKKIALQSQNLTKQSCDLAVTKLKSLEKDINKIQSSKKVLNTYQKTPAQPDSYFLDKKK